MDVLEYIPKTGIFIPDVWSVLGLGGPQLRRSSRRSIRQDRSPHLDICHLFLWLIQVFPADRQ